MNTTSGFSERRLIENEKVLRANNHSAKEAIKKYFSADKQLAHKQPIGFYCECSLDSCDKQIDLSIDEYETAHQRRDRFTIIDGHELSGIEKVVTRKPHYVIVQKFNVPA